MSKDLAVVALLGLVMLGGCKPEVIEPHDPAEQRRKDVEIINAYIQENELSPVDTTASGARYVIMDYGSGDSVFYNDIVYMHYTASTIDGVVFDTSIPEVADTVLGADPSIYEPIIFTYTASGWTLLFVPTFYNMSGDALGEVVTETFFQFRTGGHVHAILPSDQAFGASSFGPVDPYSVVVYDLYLHHVQ